MSAASLPMVAVGDDTELKHKWLNSEMKKRSRDFSDVIETSVFCGTWNVNNNNAPSEPNFEVSFENWLLPTGKPPCDVYAIGFQEIINLGTLSIMMGSGKCLEKASVWKNSVQNALESSGCPYTLIAEKHLVGSLLILLVKDSILPLLSDIRLSSHSTGTVGRMSDKGGIGIRLRLYDSTICFVCSHLRPQRDAVAGRNSDVKIIQEKMVFAPLPAKARQYGGPSRQWANDDVNNTVKILDHDYVFWLGGLNYGIDTSVSAETILSTLGTRPSMGAWATLLESDQLTIERRKGNVFMGFEEGNISFPPTFMSGSGGSVGSSKKIDHKSTPPCWSDRILWWRNISNTGISTSSYTAGQLSLSDHKPVCAQFIVDILAVDPQRENDEYSSQLQLVDRWENSATPKIVLDPSSIDFGVLAPQSSTTIFMSLENAGKGPVSWEFIQKPDNGEICRPWLNLSPLSGVVAPGEEAEIAVNIDFIADVARSFFCRTSSQTILEDIAIIRVLDGKDHFCLFSAQLDSEALKEGKYEVSLRNFDDDDGEDRDSESSGINFGDLYESKEDFTEEKDAASATRSPGGLIRKAPPQRKEKRGSLTAAVWKAMTGIDTELNFGDVYANRDFFEGDKDADVTGSGGLTDSGLPSTSTAADTSNGTASMTPTSPSTLGNSGYTFRKRMSFSASNKQSSPTHTEDTGERVDIERFYGDSGSMGVEMPGQARSTDSGGSSGSNSFVTPMKNPLQNSRRRSGSSQSSSGKAATPLSTSSSVTTSSVSKSGSTDVLNLGAYDDRGGKEEYEESTRDDDDDTASETAESESGSSVTSNAANISRSRFMLRRYSAHKKKNDSVDSPSASARDVDSSGDELGSAPAGEGEGLGAGRRAVPTPRGGLLKMPSRRKQKSDDTS